jgi:hypothetical protein
MSTIDSSITATTLWTPMRCKLTVSEDADLMSVVHLDLYPTSLGGCPTYYRGNVEVSKESYLSYLRTEPYLAMHPSVEYANVDKEICDFISQLGSNYLDYNRKIGYRILSKNYNTYLENFFTPKTPAVKNTYEHCSIFKIIDEEESMYEGSQFEWGFSLRGLAVHAPLKNFLKVPTNILLYNNRFATFASEGVLNTKSDLCSSIYPLLKIA